ncbi:hypothetical protein KR038_008097, partial [Drosophila bunnanda]
QAGYVSVMEYRIYPGQESIYIKPPPPLEMCSQRSAMAGMEQDTASCMAFMPAWTYDATKNACSEFIYGGCGGNSNQFSSQTECEKACKD